MTSSSLQWLWLSALVIVLDRLTKIWAEAELILHEPVPIFPGFNLTLVYNTGAAFSFLHDAGGWQRWFFIGVATVIGAVLLAWLYRLPVRQRWLGCSLALILGGAAGNLWDRIYQGYVIDFLDFYAGTWHWPAFNVADSAITIGAVMLIIDAFFFDRAELGVGSGPPRR
jgi:signal peptidase II